MIYFPASLRIVTPGHVRCLKWLSKQGEPITMGILTKKAMKDYKKELIDFEDRFEVADALARGFNIKVVPQNSLDPSANIKIYKPDAIASGDGWEYDELKAIKKFNLRRIDIPLPKDHSSESIVNKMKML